MNNLVLSEKRRKLSFLSAFVPAKKREFETKRAEQELNNFTLHQLKEFNTSVNKEQVGRMALASSITAIAAKLAKVDGVANNHEIINFKQLYSLPKISTDYNVMFAEALNDRISFEHYATRLLIYTSSNSSMIKEFFDSCFRFAAVDGEIKPAEILFLHKLSEIFGFSKEYFLDMVRSCVMPPVFDPYLVFSLRPNFSEKDLKKSYKEVVREYAPEKFKSLVTMPEIMSIANERMEAINNLYKFAKTLVK